MNKEMVIAVNVEDAHLFMDFAIATPDGMMPVGHRSFIGTTELQEFIVCLTPPLLAALSAYLVARIQNSKKEIRIKKGDVEIEIKNAAITPDTVLSLLEKLEQKAK